MVNLKKINEEKFIQAFNQKLVAGQEFKEVIA